MGRASTKYLRKLSDTEKRDMQIYEEVKQERLNPKPKIPQKKTFLHKLVLINVWLSLIFGLILLFRLFFTPLIGYKELPDTGISGFFKYLHFYSQEKKQ